MSMTVQLDLLVTQLLCQQSNEVKVLKMAKNFTSLQVKVLYFLLRYMQKVTENYLSKATRYFYFVT